ncbi:hypothetical protein GCM10022420_088040 [Streptomyces iranensis]|uniref:Organic radical activating enzyme n=1 Tax=Streptomyces iranensis TaxID=576784 RepID=A0A061A7M5_9ACTN|nr:organic radical activating enzyme [Streptomyces iranensis]CDR13048.1 radical SAM family protein [Streptomyces iranensis]
MSWTDVLRQLRGYEVPLIVVSGGEPLSQQSRLMPLLRSLRESGCRIEIETNGTVVPVPEIAELAVCNVSPKLSHSGDPESRRIVPAALTALAEMPGTAFKFVCCSSADLDEVDRLVQRIGPIPVWIMPEARNQRDLDRNLRAISDEVIARGWNLTTRLHIAAWGDRRGV